MPAADAAVWVDVLPSMRGFAPALRAQTSAAATAEGAKAGGGFGKRFVAAAGAAMAALSVGAALKSSIDKAGQFDKTMRTIGVTTGQTGAQLKDLTALALDLGAKTTFSAQDASDAMLALSKGGLTAAQIKAGALQQTLTLASAGGLELGNAADYMVQGLTTFGLQADQANVVAAALAGGANASTASVESMGQALSQVGPSAKLAGLTIQETTGALAAFDNAGIKGSDAGTSLKTMLLNLTPTTDAASGAMKQLGLKFTDAQGQFLPLRDIAEQLKTSMAGLSAEQQTVALKTMFGNDAFRAAAVLTGQGAAGIDKYTAATSDLGAAQRLADEQTKGYAGAMEQFKGAIETAQIQLGTKLLPAVTGLLNFMSNTGLPALQGFGGEIGKLVGWFEKYQTILLPVVAGIGSLVAVVGTVIVAARIWVGITEAWAVAQGILNAVMLLNPFVLIAAAIVGLGVALVVAYQKSETFRKIVDGAFSAVKTAAGAVLDFFKTQWPLLLGILTGPIGIAVYEIHKHWDGIKGAFTTGVDSVKNALGTAWNAVTDVILGPVKTAIGGIKAAWDSVMGFLHPIFRVIQGLFELYTGIWKLAITTAFNAIKTVIGAVLGAVKKLIDLELRGIQIIWSAAWGAVKNFLTPIWNAIKTVVSTALNAVATFVVNRLNELKRGWEVVWNAIKAFLTPIWNAIKTVVSTAFNVVKNTITTVGNTVKTIWDGIWNGIKTAASRVWDAVENRVHTAMDRIKSTIEGAKKLIGTVWGGVIDAVKQPISDLFRWINDHLVHNINGITGKFTDKLQIGDLPTGFAEGGHVRGPGGPRDDAIPARLSNGEFVMRASAVKAYGLDVMNALNTQAFADGGFVGNIKKGARKVGRSVATGASNTVNFGADIFQQGVRAAAEHILGPLKGAIQNAWGGKGILTDTGVAAMTKVVDAVINWGGQQDQVITQAPSDGGASAIPGAVAALIAGLSQNVVFPLPAGSYSVGVPMNGYPGHGGQDFPAPTGTPVFSPINGMFLPRTLRDANGAYRSYGNMANVYGANGLRFIGGHLSAFSRGAGLVHAGEQIGRVGSTGHSSGSHLHAEFRRFGSIINPHQILKFDQGGNLPPGYSTVLNATGRPEPVFNRQQFAALSKGGGSAPPLVQVLIDGHEIESAVVRVSDRRDLALSDGLLYRGNG